MKKQQAIEKRWIMINRLFILLIILTGVMILYREYQSFTDSVSFFNQSSYDSRVDEIKREVDSRIEEIAIVNAEIDEQYQQEIKDIVQEVDFFASQSLESLDGSSTLEDKREAYINIIYNYDQRNEEYLFFAMDLSGLSYLSGTTKTLEGTDISGLVDQVTGRLFVQDMIDTINSSATQDGFVTYHWMKEAGGEHLEKTSYIYYNEDVDLFIGTGIYDVDYVKSIQLDFFERISDYYQSENDYVYVCGYDGTVYFHQSDTFDTDDLLEIQTTSGVGFHDYIVSNLQEQESVEFEYIFDYYQPNQLKYGYARRIEDWDIYIGRSIVVEDLLVEQEMYFQSLVVDYIWFNILFIVIVLTLVIVIKRLINENFNDIRTVFEEQSDTLKELSYKDQLTNLYNRTYFDVFIQNIEFTDNVVTAVMLDANGLKLINDAYGHLAGDELLIKLVSILLNVFEKGTHFRWGGDEFVVILEDTTEEYLKKHIEMFQTKCKNTQIKDFNVSASLGYAQGKLTENTLYHLIDQAEVMMYNNKMYESLSTKRLIIDNILSTLYNNFSYEESHSEHVKEYSLKIGEDLSLSKEDMSKIRLAALLHDVGKIGVPDNILNKKEKLSISEMEEIKKHPEKGLRILSAYPELSEFGNYALTHHEKYDGTGYPRGLKGQEIPLFSRIICIADAYDAMTSDRIYKKRMTKEEALEELIRNKGTQFDPTLVDLFIKRMKQE